MYLQNPLTKTQDKSLFFFSYDDAYAEVPPLVKLQSVFLLKAYDPRDQAWSRFYLTLREFVEALIYPSHGFKGPGMADVLFNP